MPDPELPAQTAPIAATAPKWKRKSRAKPKADHGKTGRPLKPGPRDKRGRPTVLTPARKLMIIERIAAGNFMTTAAAFAEVSLDAVNDCLKRGRAAHSGPDREFTVAVAKAHANWTDSLVEASSRLALADPKIALAMLARRTPEWGERDRDLTVKHTGAVGSFDVAPAMGEAVRSDPASNAAFLELLGKLSESGAFEPGGPLSSSSAGEPSGPGDDREPRPIQIATASGATKL